MHFIFIYDTYLSTELTKYLTTIQYYLHLKPTCALSPNRVYLWKPLIMVFEFYFEFFKLEFRISVSVLIIGKYLYSSYFGFVLDTMFGFSWFWPVLK